MDEEDEHSPSEYYYPKDLETFDTETETGLTESQEAIDDFINQQKSANTNKGRLLIWTLFSTTWKLMVWKMRKMKAYLRRSYLDHLLSKFVLKARRRKNGEEYEPVTVSSSDLSAVYSDT